MFQLKAKLIYNKKIKDDYLRCIFQAPKIAKEAQPGQFVNIKLTHNAEPLLRRPFSIHRIGSRANTIEILYEVVGPGTEILAQKKAGEYLDVIGPLGSGFSILDTRYSILVGGGIGIAPLLFLAGQTRIKNPASRIQVLIGARTKNDILCEKEFKKLGCEVKIATDDGSRGFKGKVTALLKKVLPGTRYPVHGTTIYACGPKPMLKEISHLSKSCKIPAQVSLDEHMACGIGACLGCVVNTVSGYKRACKEGPVFNAREIVW